MFKALVIWYNNKVASFLPSAIDTMKAELRLAEMEYLASVRKLEEAEAFAARVKVDTKAQYETCKRLQEFIEFEQRALDREKEAKRNVGLEAVMAEVAVGFAELEAAIAASEAELQTKQMKEAVNALSPLAMDDDEFKKVAEENPAPKPSGFKTDKETLGRETVAEKMGAQNLKKKVNQTEISDDIKKRFGL